MLQAGEEHPPPGAAAVKWVLLSTRPLAAPEAALQCLRWSGLRWRIEGWHRVLKSGYRLEALAHATAERLRRASAINLVIAWRILLLTRLGRETPELPAAVLFADLELKALEAYAKDTGCPCPRASGRPYALGPGWAAPWAGRMIRPRGTQ